MRAAFLTFSVLLAACGPTTTIDGQKYKTACAQPSDCVAVFFGDQCGACACPNAAISKSDQVTYEADRSSAIAVCGPRPAVACAACQDHVLTCTSGLCGLQ